MATGGVSPSGGGGHGGRRRGRRSHQFTDFPFPHITMPPPGFYDPGLAAQTRQSQRGLLDTLQDIGRSQHQTRIDSRLATGQARRGTRRSLGDIGYQRRSTKISFARDLADLALAQQRGDEDYGIALTNLTRKYVNMASSQTQAGTARGVAGEGGFAAAAQAARTANKAIEEQPITLSHTRLGEDIGLKRERATQDVGRTLGRYGVLAHRERTDLHTQLNEIVRSKHRALAANRIRKSRAIREQGLFSLDQAQQAFFAAHAEHPTVKFPSLAQIRRGTNRRGRPR